MSAALPQRDWRCMGCQEMVPAKFASCRKCGSQKPINADIGAAIAAEQQMALVPIAPSESSVIRELTKGEEWQCPLCKDWSFANRNTCRRCGCPRPEGATVVTAQQHQLSQGGYIGYLPDPSKVEAVSSWAKQFDRGLPAPSIVSLCASMQDPSAPYCPCSSSSSSSSDSSDSSSSDSDSDSQPKKKKLKKDEAAKKNKTLDKKNAQKSSSSGSSSSDREKNKKKKTDTEGKSDKKKEAIASKAAKAKTDSDKTKAGNEAKAKPKECLKGHALQEFSTHHSSFSCSLCKKTLPKNSKMFGCRPCDYDECGDCYSKDSAAKESEQDKGEKNKENSGEKDQSKNKDTKEQKKADEPNGSAKPPEKPKSKLEKEKQKKEKKQKKAMDVDEELERRRLQRERRKNRVVSLG